MSGQQARHGWFWGPLLLAGAILVASVPMLAGIALTALIPWFGQLRAPIGTVLLHVLWMYPALWLYGLVAEPVEKFYLDDAKQRAVQNPGRLPPGFWIERVADLCGWLVLCLMYTVVFIDTLGTIVASLLTAALYRPTMALLERETPTQD